MSRLDPIARFPRPRRSARMLPLLILFAAVVLAGAALAEEKKKDKGGDGLSDAAKETAKPSSEQRVVHADKGKDRDCDDCSASLIGVSIYDPGHHHHHHDSGWGIRQKIHLTTMTAISSNASPDFGPSQLFGLRAGIGDPRRTSLDLALLGGRARFAAGTDMAALLRRPYEFAIETSVRHSLTSEYGPVGIAPIVGFRAGVLTWDYLNGIWLERDGEVTLEHSDRIAQYSPFAGVALTFARGEHIELGGAVLAGWRFYGSHSSNGLRNDLFDDGRFTELRLETRYTF